MTVKKTKTKPRKKKTDQEWFESIGPVENLESYVKADWWRQIFNANYLRTDGDVVEDISITQREIDLFLETLSPEKDSYILDLCCGQGRHAIELARRGFRNVTGIDRSHYLINRAKTTSRKEGFLMTFREGDAENFLLLQISLTMYLLQETVSATLSL